MKNRHRVVWTKGMFLTPQHFQTQAQFLEDALQFRFAASHFANWGVTELDIDSDALGNGLFRLNKCAGIMPDGEPFDIPEVDEMPGSRSITEHFPPNRESVDIYLGIPEERPRARNVTIQGTSQTDSASGPPSTRYLAETRMFTDENTGNEDKPVQVARRTFRVLFEDEYRSGFSAFRIAQLTRSAP